MPPRRADNAFLSSLRRQPLSNAEALATASHGSTRLMAVQTRYCGRCGAPLLPGAVFCGRCGAPQLAPAAVMPMAASALAAPPMAPPAAYGYRVAQPGAFPQAARAKVPQWMVIGGVLAVLAVAI